MDWLDALKGWAKRSGRFLLDYVELLIAAVGGIAVAILGWVGGISGDHLTEATVGLLGVLAVGVVRERLQRHHLRDQLDQAAALATATKPWQTLNEEMTWDLETRDRAKASVVKELLIAQNEVLTYYEYGYSGQPGDDLRREFKGGLKGGGSLRPLPILHTTFPGADGKIYRVISLERVCRRGEIMCIEVGREMEGRFPEARGESVGKEIASPTSRLLLRVIWPSGVRPTAVRVDQTDQPQKIVDPSRLKRRDGRLRYEEEFVMPRLRDRVSISWDWE